MASQLATGAGTRFKCKLPTATRPGTLAPRVVESRGRSGVLRARLAMFEEYEKNGASAALESQTEVTEAISRRIVIKNRDFRDDIMRIVDGLVKLVDNYEGLCGEALDLLKDLSPVEFQSDDRRDDGVSKRRSVRIAAGGARLKRAIEDLRGRLGTFDNGAIWSMQEEVLHVLVAEGKDEQGIRVRGVIIRRNVEFLRGIMGLLGQFVDEIDAYELLLANAIGTIGRLSQTKISLAKFKAGVPNVTGVYGKAIYTLCGMLRDEMEV